MRSNKRSSLGVKLTWAYKSSDQSITAGNEDLISFDSELQDDGGLHDNSTNNSRMTATRTGLYQLKWRVLVTSANAGAAGKLVTVNVYKNGTKVAEANTEAVATSNTLSPAQRLTLVGTMDLGLNATDYVELKVLNDCGQTILVKSGATGTGFQCTLFAGTSFAGGGGSGLTERWKYNKGANLGLTSGVQTNVPWDGSDTARWTTSGLTHVPGGAHPERIVVINNGVYALAFRALFASNATGERLAVIEQFDSSDVLKDYFDFNIAAVNGDNTSISASAHMQAVVGDYFVFQAYQNSTGPLNLMGGAGVGWSAASIVRTQ